MKENEPNTIKRKPPTPIKNKEKQKLHNEQIRDEDWCEKLKNRIRVCLVDVNSAVKKIKYYNSLPDE